MASKPVPASSAPHVLGRTLLPLRAFLGFTFYFAGLQKLVSKVNVPSISACPMVVREAMLRGVARTTIST